jgi:hypothetical protein
MNRLSRFFIPVALFLCAVAVAQAQFKEIKAAPFPPTVARQKIRTLLAKANAGNRDQTVATILDWVKWYRGILDDEMIARWKSPDRANLALLMRTLSDARVAREFVEFSWREDRAGSFTPANAATLEDLMSRYPESAKPFFDDLTPPAVLPPLAQPQAEAVCRILLDLPDIGTWKKDALRILPGYRAAADQLTKQDMAGPDQEKAYRAMRWRKDLNLDPPVAISQKASVQTVKPAAASQVSLGSLLGRSSPSERPHVVGFDAGPVGAYNGPMSGTYQSTGGPIPPGGEYTFPNIPPVKLLLDFDTKHWEARLAPGEGQTQVLVLTNKGKSAQKKCVVHWTIEQ